MATQYGFFPAAGTDYSAGVEPQIASRLRRLGRALKLHIIGVSGYRSPAHSVAVGGFANDPHTKGQASDSPGTENVPESILERYGLTRPFPGAGEADHIQLFGKSTMRPVHQTASYSLADLWIQAGGPRNLAPIMAAIAMAESGGVNNKVSPQNTDGTYDLGTWQINSVHTQFDRAKLLGDPLYNARAAVAVFRSQGLGAWTTYTSGAYQSYMGNGKQKGSEGGGVVRPGGEAPGSSSTDGVDSIFASYIQGTGASDGTTQDASLHLPNPLDPLSPLHTFGLPDPLSGIIPNPLKLFSDPANAIKDTQSFLKWIAWLFHPVNVLRAVEFVTGFTLLIIGVQSMAEVWRGDPQQSIIARTGRATKRTASDAVSVTPVGRARRVQQAAKAGRGEARSAHRSREVSAARRKGRVKENKRLEAKRTKKQSKKSLKDTLKGEDIPF